MILKYILNGYNKLKKAFKNNFSNAPVLQLGTPSILQFHATHQQELN